MSEKYEFKLKAEAGYAVFTAIAIALAELLISFDPNTVTDWKTYALSAVGAVARAVGAGFLNAMLRKGA